MRARDTYIAFNARDSSLVAGHFALKLDVLFFSCERELVAGLVLCPSEADYISIYAEKVRNASKKDRESDAVVCRAFLKTAVHIFQILFLSHP